jgi:hypothetical protein
MTNSLRLTIASVVLLASAACSRSSEQPALSDELKQDLARAGAGEVQLAGASTVRLEVVSASERTDGAARAPKSPAVSRAPSAVRGKTAMVKSARKVAPAVAQAVAPAVAQPAPRAPEPAPVEVYVEEPAPEPVPAQARPRAPQPSTQREPPGGWRSPGEVIRNAPFPINP